MTYHDIEFMVWFVFIALPVYLATHLVDEERNV